jgi:hypothetical protein
MRPKMLVCCMAFLGLAGSLQAADPFAGTWKMNIAKSKPAPAPSGMAVMAETLIVVEIGDHFDVTARGTHENGSAISSHTLVPLNGGAIRFPDGAPPAGAALVMKRVNDRAFDLIRMSNAKAVSVNHITMSADGKTMLGNIAGLDAQGNAVHGMELWDKQ